MGFKRGDTWSLAGTGEVVTVESPRELKYRGQVKALTPLAKVIRADHPHLKGRIGQLLIFEGETIEERYNRTYGSRSSS